MKPSPPSDIGISSILIFWNSYFSFSFALIEVYMSSDDIVSLNLSKANNIYGLSFMKFYVENLLRDFFV